jgi:CheY-like chemotaxis protein
LRGRRRVGSTGFPNLIHRHAATQERCAEDARRDKVSTYILVVDDEPDVESMFRQHFRRDLRASRFVMAFATSARAALEQVKAIADPSLILILSDINMPGMSGLEMLAEVKAARPNVPVIMITAYGDDDTKMKATKLGAAGLLTKPIDFSLLRHEIDQRLDRAS